MPRWRLRWMVGGLSSEDHSRLDRPWPCVSAHLLVQREVVNVTHTH
jgi:hypothetical protein